MYRYCHRPIYLHFLASVILIVHHHDTTSLTIHPSLTVNHRPTPFFSYSILVDINFSYSINLSIDKVLTAKNIFGFALFYRKIGRKVTFDFATLFLFSSGMSTFIFVYENSVIQLYKNSVHFARGVSGRTEKNLKIWTH